MTALIAALAFGAIGGRSLPTRVAAAVARMNRAVATTIATKGKSAIRLNSGRSSGAIACVWFMSLPFGWRFSRGAAVRQA